jgi:hypothetical protein
MRSVRRTTTLSIAIAAALSVPLGVTTSALGSGIDQAHSAVGDTARLNPAGTAVHLVGVVRCAGCRAFTLGATVSQRSSGAVGQGGVRCICKGTVERWLVTARAREAHTFLPGCQGPRDEGDKVGGAPQNFAGPRLVAVQNHNHIQLVGQAKIKSS